jgi:galactokinase
VAPSPRRSAAAFAPGRVNVIGEHTDYNGGLALPFAIAAGITVRATALGSRVVRAHALDLHESDEFDLSAPQPADGWRAYVRGVVAELAADGLAPSEGFELEIAGDLAQGAGLSSSAALTVALCLALIELAGQQPPDRVALAELCARVENRWAGAETGLLDQLASLCGAEDAAVRIDFATLAVEPVPLRLDGWRLVLADSGERHVHGSSGYNERRAECRRACELLGVGSLREADATKAAELPSPLDRRVRHVIEENERVEQAVAALRSGDLTALGGLLDESHRSLRDLYEISTPTVEQTRERLLRDGARGARLVGGGFGGAVLGLLDAETQVPAGALEVSPGPGAHLLETS